MMQVAEAWPIIFARSLSLNHMEVVLREEDGEPMHFQESLNTSSKMNSILGPKITHEPNKGEF